MNQDETEAEKSSERIGMDQQQILAKQQLDDLFYPI